MSQRLPPNYNNDSKRQAFIKESSQSWDRYERLSEGDDDESKPSGPYAQLWGTAIQCESEPSTSRAALFPEQPREQHTAFKQQLEKHLRGQARERKGAGLQSLFVKPRTAENSMARDAAQSSQVLRSHRSSRSAFGPPEPPQLRALQQLHASPRMLQDFDEMSLSSPRAASSFSSSRQVSLPTEASIRHQHMLTVAIDIGTGFSGYASAFTSSPLEIRMNKNWGEGSFSSYKTPTAILTTHGAHGDFVKFGYEAEEMYRDSDPESDPETGEVYELYTDFKMLLYNEKNLDIERTMATSTSRTKRKLVDLFIMTLLYLKDHLLEAITNSTKCKSVPEDKIRWVLTVPTIWGDKAKSFMRHAAKEAGLIGSLHSDRLIIKLEAMAAARYCRSTANTQAETAHMESDYEEVNLPVGSKYFVADAGAGTLDCTAFHVEGPQRMREIMIASGQDLGGNQVDANFLELMKVVLGQDFITEFKTKQPVNWLKFTRDFEQAKSKAQAGGRGMKVPIPHGMFNAMEDMKGGDRKALTSHINAHTSTHGVKESNGILCINQEIVEDVIFGPVIREVTAHIKEHLKKPEVRDVKYVYLVGGFGTCKLLQDSLSDLLNSFDRGYQLVKPLECQTAVIKGAVILGHHTTNNTETVIRRSKMTYGVATDSPFDSRVHDPSKAMKVSGQLMCKDLFLPFVQQNDEVWKNNPDAHCTMLASPTHEQATSVVVDFYGLDRRSNVGEIIYVDSPELKKVGSVRVEMPRVMKTSSREVELKFDFGDEVIVKAKDLSSGKRSKLKLSLEFTS